MQSLPTTLEGPVLIAADVHRDERGFFQETFRASRFAELGVSAEMVQDNHSRSSLGVVRGMHFQPGMAKLVRCARGSIFDVVVDLRRGSPTFGRWEGWVLSEDNGQQLYCPDGFAHGFCVTSEVADVLYKCSDYWNPETERGFAYDDPEVGIAWPEGLELSASPRDAAAPPLSAIADELPFLHQPA